MGVVAPVTTKWLIQSATGEIVSGGHVEPKPEAGFEVVSDPDGLMHDARAERWDGAAFVAKSPAEIATYDDAQLDERARLSSQAKDALAICALVVRSRNVAAWNAMTTPQKVSAARAEADVLRSLRVFAEKFL
jgi:hypothetical protein